MLQRITLALPFSIFIVQIDRASGNATGRQPLPYVFDTEEAARTKADELAGAHLNRRFIEQSGLWEYTGLDGKLSRIVVEKA